MILSKLMLVVVSVLRFSNRAFIAALRMFLARLKAMR
jgi:hypothetical protein